MCSNIYIKNNNKDSYKITIKVYEYNQLNFRSWIGVGTFELSTPFNIRRAVKNNELVDRLPSAVAQPFRSSNIVLFCVCRSINSFNKIRVASVHFLLQILQNILMTLFPGKNLVHCNILSVSYQCLTFYFVTQT